MRGSKQFLRFLSAHDYRAAAFSIRAPRARPRFRINRFSLTSLTGEIRRETRFFVPAIGRSYVVEKRNERAWTEGRGKECLPRVPGLSSHYRGYLTTVGRAFLRA